MKWFDDIWKTAAKNYTSGYIGETGPAVGPDASYVTIDIVSLWIPYVREGLSKFYGAVHGAVDLMGESGGIQKFQMFDVLGDAKQLDAAHLDRIIQGPFGLLAGVPYRGGGIFLRIGLFSVKSADLTLPYLSLLTKMSAVAGMAFIPQAMPFINLIRDGVSTIAEGDHLEIGRSGNFDPVNTGLYAVLRATSDEVPLASLAFNEETRELTSGGQRVQKYPYMVIKIQASPDRQYFYDIPGVKEAFQRMKEQFKNTPKDIEANKKAFEEFEVTVRLSPDLLSKHAESLIDRVGAQFSFFLSEARRSAPARDSHERLDVKLKDINPFVDAP